MCVKKIGLQFTSLVVITQQHGGPVPSPLPSSQPHNIRRLTGAIATTQCTMFQGPPGRQARKPAAPAHDSRACQPAVLDHGSRARKSAALDHDTRAADMAPVVSRSPPPSHSADACFQPTAVCKEYFANFSNSELISNRDYCPRMCEKFRRQKCPI